MTRFDSERIRSLIKEKKAILVDIREKAEWDIDHISIAVHFPLSTLLKSPPPSDFKKFDTVFLHCQKGGRTLIAQKHLSSYLQNIEPLLVPYDVLKNELS